MLLPIYVAPISIILAFCQAESAERFDHDLSNQTAKEEWIVLDTVDRLDDPASIACPASACTISLCRRLLEQHK